MSQSETIRAFSTKLPQWLQRNRQQVVKGEVRTFDGSVVAPESGTYTLKDQGGTAIIDAEAVTVTANVAQYTVTTVHLPDTISLGEGYLEEWALTFGSEVQTFRRPAAVVLRVNAPVVTSASLHDEYSDLDRIKPRSIGTLEKYVEQAWYDIQARLISRGNLPYLVMSDWSLREVHIHRALYRMWRDFDHAASDSGFRTKRDHHAQQFESKWGELKFHYDPGHDGEIDAADELAPAETMLYIGGGGGGGWW